MTESHERSRAKIGMCVTQVVPPGSWYSYARLRASQKKLGSRHQGIKASRHQSRKTGQTRVSVAVAVAWMHGMDCLAWHGVHVMDCMDAWHGCMAWTHGMDCMDSMDYTDRLQLQ